MSDKEKFTNFEWFMGMSVVDDDKTCWVVRYGFEYFTDMSIRKVKNAFRDWNYLLQWTTMIDYPSKRKWIKYIWGTYMAIIIGLGDFNIHNAIP